MSIRISDQLRYWEKFFVQEFCKIDFRSYSYCKNICHKNILNSSALEKKIYRILSKLKNFKDYKDIQDEELSVAYQILTILILETGSLLPEQLRGVILEILEREFEMIHQWNSNEVLIRKWYLNDFKTKINSHERRKKHLFLSLNVNNDIEFKTSIFGLNSLEKEDHNENISYINLNNCNLSHLPQKLKNYKNIEKLSLSYNNLSKLNFDFTKLKSLKKLILNDNHIENFPETFFTLSNLEELHISFNRLKFLSENIKKFRNLKILNLFNNDLKSLPKSITSLKNLEELNISFNNIPKLPKKIHSLERLKIKSLNKHECICS